jgi:hypothetical protein
MMEIELTKNTIIEGVPYEAGALVSASPQNAEKLIQRGFAVLPDQKPKSKIKKGKKWQVTQESTES